MKYRTVLRKYILTAILLCAYFHSTAQSFNVTGLLKTTDGAAILGAAVTLRKAADSLLVKGTVSDSLGRFVLAGILPGRYKLDIYGPASFHHSQALQLTDQDITLPPIQIPVNKPVNLKEVVVDAQRPFLKRDVDKLTVDIEHSIYSRGENAMRLFNVIPEVQVDALGNILFRGGEKVTVYLDNRKVQMSGQQLLNYLKSIPSESIKSYELRSVGGAQFDADNTGAIINIQLKNDYKYGLTGSVGVEYQYTRYNNISNWLSLNYRTGKFTFQAGGSFYKGKQFDDQTETQYYKATSVYSFQQNNTINRNITFGNYKFGMDYRLNDQQVLGANYEGTLFPYHPATSSINRFSTAAHAAGSDSVVYTSNNKDIKQHTQQANIFYRNKLDKKGSVLDAVYSFVRYNNNYNSAIITDHRYPANGSPDFSDSLFIDNPLTISIHTANIDLEKVLGNSWTLNIGGKYNSSSTDNNISYYMGLSSSAQFDSLRSNHFFYDEKILAFYGSITKKWKQWSLKLGLRTENTDYQGYSAGKGDSIARNRWNLFPTFFLQRKFTGEHSLTLSYSRSISRPSYQLLNPFEDIQNPFYIEKGNPLLVPYFTHSVELSYLLHSKYTFTAGYKRTDNNINRIYQHDGAVIIATYGNVNDGDNAFLSMSIPVDVTKWWQISSSFTLRYVKLDISDGMISRTRDKFSQDFWIKNRFNLPKSFYVELVGRYGRNQFLGIYDWKPQGTIEMNFKKDFFNDKLTATLNLGDPFNLKRIGWEIDEAGFTRDVNSRIPTRYISIGLSYNFSKGKKTTNRENVDRKNSDEVDRLNK